MKNILVLGASGFIGMKLIENLVTSYNIIGYDRSIKEINSESVMLQGDFCSEKNFESILTDYNIDVVYHLISTTVPNNYAVGVDKEIEQNVIATVRFLDAMKNTETKKIIFISSGGTVYGESVNKSRHFEKDALNPICSYGIQKMMIEQYLKFYNYMHGIDYLIARVANPYGKCDISGRVQGIIPILLNRLRQKEKITLYGNTIRDYIYIDDVVVALRKMLTYSGQEHTFNIGTGIGTDLNTLIYLLENITGEIFTEIDRKHIRKCDVLNNILNINTSKRELNWKPEVSLAEGIRQLTEEKI